MVQADEVRTGDAASRQTYLTRDVLVGYAAPSPSMSVSRTSASTMRISRSPGYVKPCLHCMTFPAQSLNASTVKSPTAMDYQPIATANVGYPLTFGLDLWPIAATLGSTGVALTPELPIMWPPFQRLQRPYRLPSHTLRIHPHLASLHIDDSSRRARFPSGFLFSSSSLLALSLGGTRGRSLQRPTQPLPASACGEQRQPGRPPLSISP